MIFFCPHARQGESELRMTARILDGG